jgi:nitrile hydratase subunit beta
MNGVHDLGGMEGLGPVNPPKEEPVFRADWERTAFTLFVPSVLAGLNLDEFRHGIEKMHPAEYLTSPYYEHWVHTIEKNLIEKGVITEKELSDRVAQYRQNPDAPLPDRKDPDQVELHLAIMRSGASTRMPTDATPRFKAGDAVIVKNAHPSGHTRMARYLRGKRGVIDRVYDSFIFPDSNAHRQGENPQYVYSVRFDAAHVWGKETSEPNETIYFDLWEPYLEPASAGKEG